MRFTHHRCNHTLIWFTGNAPRARGKDNPYGTFVNTTRTRIGSGNFDSNVEDYL